MIFRTLLLALCTVALNSFGNNWPSFRGQNGNGIGSGSPPVTWNVELGKNVIWKTPVPGLSISSPIIWGDRVFLTAAVGAEKHPEFKHDPTWGYRILREKDNWSFNVICLDKKSGRVLWDTTAHSGIPQQGRHSESTYANPTPATDGKNLVVSFGSHGLYCLDLDGKLLWQTDLGHLSGAPSDNKKLDWGYSSSPIIHEDKVIVQCDTPLRAFIAVIDLQTGKETLSINRRGTTTWATPSIAKTGNRTLLICNGYQNASAFDLTNGKRIWWFAGRGDIPVPRPLVLDDSVILTAAHGGRSIHSVSLDATGDLTPNPGDNRLPPGLNWWSPRRGSYIPTPVAHEGILYIAAENGIMTTVDAKTGKQHYQERLSARRGGMAYASPVIAGGHVYIPRNDGKIHVISTGTQFRTLATIDMGETTMASPAISDGRIFIRTLHHLYCIGTKK